MRKFRVILFISFILLYVIGLCIGCFTQIKAEDQSGMYEYLENAVSVYDVSIKDNIINIFFDNLKTLGLFAFGGLIPLGLIIFFIMMIIKGYTAGFAITAMLRLFGARGILICGGNLLSCAILIPALSWYCSASSINLIYDRKDKGIFFKKYFVLVFLLLLVLSADSVMRGILSALLLKQQGGV